MRLSKNQFCKLSIMYFLLFLLSYAIGKYAVLTYVKFNTETTLPRISVSNTYDVTKTCEPLDMTGFLRNHNCGFIHDVSGYTSGQPGVLCTVANHSLWEYRIMYIP